MSSPASLQAFPTLGWADMAGVLDQALSEECGLVGLALVDIDRFSDLTERICVESNVDFLIAALTRRLSAQLVPGDVAAQVGDDKFLIVRTPLTGPAEIEGLGIRIVDSFQQPLVVDGVGHECTTSVGVSTSRRGDSSSGLIRFTQYALDDAKALGRNRMVAFADEDRDLLRDTE